MLRRLVIALCLGSTVTLALLLVMQALIATGRTATSQRHASVRISDFVRIQRPQVVRTKPKRPTKPPDAQRQPQLAPHGSGSSRGNQLRISLTVPKPRTDQSGRHLSLGPVDGDVISLVKVAPVYPEQALEEGREGYVVVEYTVTSAGTTEDPRVIESTNAVFNQAAIESVRKYKYRPRVVNGVPVDVPGVKTKIRFVLEH